MSQMKTVRERAAIEQYNRDIVDMDGYIYTGVKSRKSMHIFNKRASAAIRNLIDASGKSVIDIGCGDGTYSVELLTSLNAASVIGVDPSDAWKLAEKKYGGFAPRVRFVQGSAYELNFPDKYFDFAIMRGVLHHLDDPVRGIHEMARVADGVCLLEPNGFNPVIKLLERVSPYHRAHGEKSFSPSLIRYWMNSLCGRLMGESYTSLVPLFCPSAMAIFLDWLSPRWERLPLIPKFTCGLYCVSYSFGGRTG
jgi:ubiquinone/menaquinone biosynthesis C-methylase UbiE